MNEIKKKIVMYAPHCVRGEIIALLYNHAAQKKSNVTITSEAAESFVVKELGMVRTLDGKIVPCQDGFIGMINGIPLNITCHKGSVDVSE